jgi:AAHS family benzoate transporter-like MFS transporter
MVSPPTSRPNVVAAVCFALFITDAFDLVVFGIIVPSLLKYEPWALTPAEVGLIGSYSLIGMLIGALLVGYLGDRFPRNVVITATVAEYSVFALLCAIAPSPEMLGVFRFLAGLGLGGLTPVLMATMRGAAPSGRAYWYQTLISMSYPIGAVLVALTGIYVLPLTGFRAMFAIAALPGLLMLPLAYLLLPRTAPRRQVAQAAGGSRRSVYAELFSPRYRRATLLFPVITFVGFLLLYGINTWLPEIMVRAGYSLGSSLSFLMVLNAGALVGTLLAARIADRIGGRRMIAIALGVAAVSIAIMSLQPGQVALYVLLAVGGFGMLGSSILVNGLVTGFYPAHMRSTGLGWAAGIGRIGGICAPLLGGFLLSAKIGLVWNFYILGAAALVASLVVLAVPKPRPEDQAPVEQPVEAAQGTADVREVAL